MEAMDMVALLPAFYGKMTDQFPMGAPVRVLHLGAKPELNGRTGVIVDQGTLADFSASVKPGGAPFRLGVQIDELAGKSPGSFKLRPRNIMMAEVHVGNGEARMPETASRAMMQAALERWDANFPGADPMPDRPDVTFRVGELRRWLRNEPGAVLPRCGPMGVPEQVIRVMQGRTIGLMFGAALACTGDGTVDFQRLADGLAGEGAMCAVCLENVADAIAAEVAAGDDQEPFGLPCRHVFHRGCVAEWLASQEGATGDPASCPVCRSAIPCGAEAYCACYDREDMLAARADEWFLTGSCECCQARLMEADPLVYVDTHGHKEWKEGMARSNLPPWMRYGVRYNVGGEFPNGLTIRRSQGKFSDGKLEMQL
jgi:hypothetical protein